MVRRILPNELLNQPIEHQDSGYIKSRTKIRLNLLTFTFRLSYILDINGMKMKAVIVFTVLVAFASSKPVHKNSKHGTTLAGTIEERLAALELKYEEKLSSQEKKIAKLENQLDAYDGKNYFKGATIG